MLDWRVDGLRPNHSFEADAAKGAAPLNSNVVAPRKLGASCGVKVPVG